MKKIIIYSLGTFLTLGLYAQSIERYVIGSAGGSYYNGVDFEMDYTVGEVAITTISNTNNTLTQGFQQPYTLAWVAVQEYSGDPARVILYPNPIVDQLSINIENAQTGTYRIMVFDLLGQLLNDEQVTAGFDNKATIDIDFGRYATGNYFVRIMHDRKIIQTGKVVKIRQ